MVPPSLRPPAAASLVSFRTPSPGVPRPSVPGPPPTLQGVLPLATGTLLGGSQTQVFRPSEGPSQNLPPGAKNVIFLTPSGAKLWGSGGAPPTNLILLRNQFTVASSSGRPRRPRAPRRNRPRSDPSTHPRPTQAPPRPHPSRWLVGCWRLAVGVGGGPRLRVVTEVGAVASDKYGPQDGDAHLRLRRLRLQRDL